MEKTHDGGGEVPDGAWLTNSLAETAQMRADNAAGAHDAFLEAAAGAERIASRMFLEGSDAEAAKIRTLATQLRDRAEAMMGEVRAERERADDARQTLWTSPRPTPAGA